ncbi:hypothetical protein [Marinifaba aquimaris]|uniref:hypothetical protein n=1 Tax=Marinifaba aquimaris TaxID=2741323 RepID=UPI001FE488DA|nr:hypothetical protein [Marinifaba aquimaris]
MINFIPTLPKETTFNRFFQSHDYASLTEQFDGLYFTRRFEKSSKKRRFFKDHPERFLVKNSDKHFAGWLSLACMFIGFAGSFCCAIYLPAWLIFFFGEPFDYHFFIAVLIWNLFWLNAFPWSMRVGSDNIIYFDRLTGRVGYTKPFTHQTEKDEFGNASFAWQDIVCTTQYVVTTQYGNQAHIPYIQHRDLDTYPESGVEVAVSESANSRTYCYLFWEEVCRFMDNTKPLPDVPVYEAVRHLDPVTATFDKENGRPERFWQDMSFDQQYSIEAKLISEAFDFAFDKPQAEITKPWEIWPIDPEMPLPVFDNKYKFKRLLKQITFGYPL